MFSCKVPLCLRGLSVRKTSAGGGNVDASLGKSQGGGMDVAHDSR